MQILISNRAEIQSGKLRLDFPHAIRDSDAPELCPITPAQAIQIREFVRFHQAHIAAIVVHCEQGFSRSPAIAAAIAESLGLDHIPFLKNYAANYYVYDTVFEAFELHSNPPTN